MKKRRKKSFDIFSRLFQLPKKKPIRKSLKPPTDVQALQRLKFGLAASFVSKISEAVNIGFKMKSKGKSQTCMNMCSSYIIKQAVSGRLPNLCVDYSLVSVSLGRLQNIDFPSLKLAPEGTGRLKWSNDECEIHGSERIYLLIYNSTKEKVIHSDYVGQRLDLKAEFQLQPFHLEDELHCWVFLKALDSAQVSNSIYISEVDILMQ